MFLFGSGVLIGTPSGANPTPINFGLVQDVTYDETATLKSLFGQNRRALAVGAGTIKTTLKAKSARISGTAFASLYYGLSLVAGQTTSIIGESRAMSGSPVTVAQAATYTGDLGVVFADTGLPLTRVAAGPITGQYSVNTGTGVYTFAAADNTRTALISYNYTIAGTGQKFTINNPLLGATITFATNLYGLDPTNGSSLTLQLFNCVMAKLSFGTKLEDFTMPDFEAECYVNAAGNLGQWNFPDIA